MKGTVKVKSKKSDGSFNFGDEVSAAPIGTVVGTRTQQMSLFLASTLVEGFSGPENWVTPKGLPAGHNGDQKERLTTPVAGKQPHIMMILFDDYGWADAGWHRDYKAPGGEVVPATPEVSTPNLDALVKEGIDLDRCAPPRSPICGGFLASSDGPPPSPGTTFTSTARRPVRRCRAGATRTTSILSTPRPRSPTRTTRSRASPPCLGT